ncbi:hypothetical protein P8452_10551 [Trifolium repens]|nr:hypothetical protein P8452_10551 [Trifolium repens]
MNSYSTMSSNSLNLFFLFILTTFLLLSSTSKAQNQNPTFLYQFCSTNKTTANSTYKSNLRTLFSSLSSNAAKEFYNTTVPSRTPSNTVYGLYMCRGDVSSSPCQQCVTNATQKLSTDSDCSLSKRAVIWYDECMVRYSNTSFFSMMATNPGVILMNTGNITNQESFMPLMFNTMNKTADKAANSSVGAKNKIAERVLAMLYMAKILAMIPQGKQGGRLLFPSCNVRYEVYPFYHNLAPSPSPSPPPSATPRLVPPTTARNLGGSSGISSGTIVAIVVPISVAALLLIVGVCFISRRVWKKRDSAQEPKTETDISTVESLRFDLSTLEEATNKFSDTNKLGEGGFGEVYKGLLSSGQEIAVKRLSKNSGQGGEQFKNEVELVAQLQHRNLARLLGFCLEGEEKILVYEYVANKSLDYILFDPEKQRLLDWTRRYKIIGGVARGITYLHEDSRLKIIHRDLKASNILLDGNMNPKISDFGMAKLFGVDQTQGNTSRIVGTYGYMSPEYAMH